MIAWMPRFWYYVTMKKIITALALLCVLTVSAFAQTDEMLNLREYSKLFINRFGLESKYYLAGTDEDYEIIISLGGNDKEDIDTPLEIALWSICAGVADVRPAEANVMLGNARQADQKLGAAVFQEIQILRFLGDTAAVNRHEAVLQFITGRGNATRAEIEAFYRNNVRALVSQVVDEQLAGFRNEGRQVNPSTSTLSEIKNAITEFMLAPSEATYRNLLLTYRRGDVDGSALLLGYAVGEINAEISIALANNRVLGSQ